MCLQPGSPPDNHTGTSTSLREALTQHSWNFCFAQGFEKRLLQRCERCSGGSCEQGGAFAVRLGELLHTMPSKIMCLRETR